MKQFRLVHLLLLVSLLSASVVFAQTDTGRVIGTVTDPSGAIVPGATVTITNQATANIKTVQSGADGSFSVSALPPGRYHLEAKQSGFKTATADVVLEVSQVLQVPFRLQTGSAETVVNVTDEVPLIETSTSSTGEVIQGRQVTELPLNGRNFTQLALLTPGVTRGAYGDQAMGGSNGTNSETFRNSDTGGSALAVNGLRPQANNFILDGTDNNEALVNSIVFFPPAEAIQEFRVNTTVAPAEFGRAGGAIIQTSTKSGTNSIHGSAFEFRRTDPLDATPYGYSTKPSFKRNQFGGTLGGPIWKDKLFLFGDYQAFRQSQPLAVELASVPTAKMRTGDFSELLGTSIPTIPTCAAGNPAFTGKGYIFDPRTCLPFGWNGTTGTNIIPGGSLNAAGLKYLQAFPLPNLNGVLLQNYRAQRQSIRNFNDFDVRLDYVIGTRDSVFARYSYGQDNFTVTDRLPGLPSGFGSGDNVNHPRGVSAGETHTFTSNIVNEFRFGYTRPYFAYLPPGYGTPIAANFGIPNANRGTLTGGQVLIGSGNGSELEYTGDGGPYSVPQHSWQFLDTLSMNKGRHNFKFGFNLIDRHVDFFQGNLAKGFFQIGSGNGGNTGDTTGFEASELLSGFMTAYMIGNDPSYFKTRNWETGYFAQDDWRVTNRLTLNLGIRYDLYTWPHEVNNRQSNYDPASGKLIEAGTPGWPSSLIDTDKNNFAPRIGFAYDFKGNGKTVLRGGYGLFYFLDRGGVGTQLSNNPDWNGFGYFGYSSGYRFTLTGQAPMNSTDPSAGTGAMPAPPTAGSTNVNGATVLEYPRNSQNSSIQQWNLQVERQLGTNMSADVAYVGTKMDHLATYYNANNVYFGAATTNTKPSAVLSNENVYGFIGSGNYNGLQTRLNRRFSKGLQFTAAYTWSHTLDNSNSAFSTTCSNCGRIWVTSTGKPMLDLNYGNSDSDIRHFFTFSALYELPYGRGRMFGSDASRVLDLVLGGWQWNNIVTVSTGTPIDVYLNGTPSNRPDLTGSVSAGVRGDSSTGATYFGTVSTTGPAGLSFAVPSVNGVFTRPGTLPRNYFHGPGLHAWDTSIFKNFKVTERVGSEFRFEVYNVLNSIQWQNPNLDPSNNFQNFGKLQSARLGSERQVQFALRVTF